VGRTLLSDAFDVGLTWQGLGTTIPFEGKAKIKVKSVGQECPTHTDLACPQFPQVRILSAFC